jgi:aquaporin Z
MANTSDINKFLIELLGTFFFVSVILNTLTLSADNYTGPITVAVALLAAIYFGAKVSGAHYNPAVSVSMYLKNVISANLLLGYIIFQVIGATLAVVLHNYLY